MKILRNLRSFRRFGFVLMVLALVVGMTATSSTRTVEANGSPTVGAISPAAGTLSGGTVVTVTVSGMTDFTSSLPQVLFGGVPASGVTALSVTELSVTTPASPSRSVGAVTVTVNQGSATATLPAGFSFRPVLETPRLSGFGDYAVLATGAGDSNNHMDQLVLGALASRTQGTEVNTSTVPPVFTVVGTDSRSGDLYTFETDAPYWDWEPDGADEPGWTSEGTERSGNTVELRASVADVSGTRGYTAVTGTVGGRSDIMILSSKASCGRNDGFNNINPVTGRDSYCSVFGPEV